MVSNFPRFLGIAIFLIILPGQDTALTIRNTLVGGRRGGVFTIFGIVNGLVIWTIATSAGLAALILASNPVFVAIKIAGVAYLMFLGAKALLAAFGTGQGPVSKFGGVSREMSRRTGYRQGAMSSLGNVKLGIFFTSLLPQFVPKDQPPFEAMLLLGLLFSVMTLFWLIGYAFAVAKAGDFLGRPKIRRSIDGLVGTVLVGFGVKLAITHK